MNSIFKGDSSVTGKIYVSDANGYRTCKDTGSITSNLVSVSSSAEGNNSLIARNDYSTGLFAIDSTGMKMDTWVDTGISLDEHIKNVCIKLFGNTDVYKQNYDTEDVTIPPMKGFMEI